MNKRLLAADIRNSKSKKPIVALTCYSAQMAKILDRHTDILLVGDTVGMVLYGMDSTLSVTTDIMINHGRAVVKHSNNSCVVVDMPFGSYQQSKEQAFANAAKILTQTGAQAVKLEGGIEMAETIEFLSQRGIPVMAHIGLTPQNFNCLGGYKVQGREKETHKKIIEDALTVEKSGAFSVVIECVTEELANNITKKLNIPTIGIGASNKCDGQVLVTEDMLGLFDEFTPKFVKKYANLAEQINSAVEQYANDVRKRDFPGKENVF